MCNNNNNNNNIKVTEMGDPEAFSCLYKRRNKLKRNLRHIFGELVLNWVRKRIKRKFHLFLGGLTWWFSEFHANNPSYLSL